MRTVFLDRDGVINENRPDYVRSWQEFRFISGSLDALRMLTQHKCRVFIVTNQACVNRGIVPSDTLAHIHTQLLAAARQAGAQIDAISYCPHRPEEACGCRKPEPGMLLRLAQEHGCDTSRAYMVGDAATDIMAGRAAGCRTVLVRTGRGAGQLGRSEASLCTPDMIVDDLFAATRWICGRERELPPTQERAVGARINSWQ